jgi:hypothetical protein
MVLNGGGSGVRASTRCTLLKLMAIALLGAGFLFILLPENS